LAVLLRGINLGPRNRIAMPELREVLGEAGFENVRTYVASGNVVLSTSDTAAQVAGQVEKLIAERFGLEIGVVVRNRAELAKVVRRNPLADIAEEPKRYQVTFLRDKLPVEARKKLEAVRTEPERFVLSGREVYAWHPDGVGRSKLAAALGGRELGVTATTRNWTTVTTLLEMASED
jgi:uncharacterized protein (DUF1697 family)